MFITWIIASFQDRSHHLTFLHYKIIKTFLILFLTFLIASNDSFASSVDAESPGYLNSTEYGLRISRISNKLEKSLLYFVINSFSNIKSCVLGGLSPFCTNIDFKYFSAACGSGSRLHLETHQSLMTLQLDNLHLLLRPIL